MFHSFSPWCTALLFRTKGTSHAEWVLFDIDSSLRERVHSKTGAGKFIRRKKTDSCVLPWQWLLHMRRANRFDAPAVTLHTLMKYGNYSHMKSAATQSWRKSMKNSEQIWLFPKITSAIPSPFCKHIFYVVHLLQVGAAGWPLERKGVPLIKNAVDEDRTVGGGGGGRRSPSWGFSPFFFAEVDLFPPPSSAPSVLPNKCHKPFSTCATTVWGKEMVHWLWEGGGTISSYFCEKENGWMIMVGVVNETNVDERQICQQRCCGWMRGDMDLIWSPRTITLWTAMKTWGDDVESRCGKHLWTNFRPLGVSKTCLDAGRDFNIPLQQKMTKTGILKSIQKLLGDVWQHLII